MRALASYTWQGMAAIDRVTAVVARATVVFLIFLRSLLARVRSIGREFLLETFFKQPMF